MNFTKDNIYSTERLLIRRLVEADFPGFHELQGDPEVMEYVANRANSKEEDEKDLTALIKGYSKKENEFWVWAIEKISSKVFLGTIALVKDKEDNWEVGYRLLRRMWGQGYATEALAGLISLCESIPSLNNLVAYADLRNLASQRVLAKAGFVNLGIKYNDEADSEDYIYAISTT